MAWFSIIRHPWILSSTKADGFELCHSPAYRSHDVLLATITANAWVRSFLNTNTIIYSQCQFHPKSPIFCPQSIRYVYNEWPAMRGVPSFGTNSFGPLPAFKLWESLNNKPDCLDLTLCWVPQVATLFWYSWTSRASDNCYQTSPALSFLATIPWLL